MQQKKSRQQAAANLAAQEVDFDINEVMAAQAANEAEIDAVVLGIVHPHKTRAKAPRMATAPKVPAGYFLAPSLGGLVRRDSAPENVPGTVRDTQSGAPRAWRWMQEQDFLAAFAEFVTSAHADFVTDTAAARRRVHDLTEKAAAAWDKGKSTANSAALREFCGAALFVAESDELAESLAFCVWCAVQRRGNEFDELGEFNFYHPAVARWWDRWMLQHEVREDFEACGFDLEDMQAVGTAAARREFERTAQEEGQG